MQKFHFLVYSLLAIGIIGCNYSTNPDLLNPQDSMPQESIQSTLTKTSFTVANCFEYRVDKIITATGHTEYQAFKGNSMYPQAMRVTYMPDMPELGNIYTAPYDQTRNLVIGTSGNDVIYGGSGDDCICGGDGNDTINGRRGNDKINGNRGDDIIRGGKDQDIIRGGKGNDDLYGDLGKDVVYGDIGNDKLRGGTDQVYVEDECIGGPDHDTFPDGSCEIRKD